MVCSFRVMKEFKNAPRKDNDPVWEVYKSHDMETGGDYMPWEQEIYDSSCKNLTKQQAYEKAEELNQRYEKSLKRSI
jgi:hypothetical protein